MQVFESHIAVRFKHVDAAGIMFYPRYFELINDLVEDWFASGVGESFKQLHLVEGRAVPTAHIDVNFHAPSKLDDELTFDLSVARIGTSSCTLNIHARAGDEARLSATLVIVHMDMQTGKSLPWPAHTKAAMTPWLNAHQNHNGENA
ncbi:acyl-CoA thioesterase [Kordiimonas sp.]|uniref:acyl-CoA thioesterase n=1 Tax=Kordiimonas sp. TaxID=1970157 RepID=UPI003A93934F